MGAHFCRVALHDTLKQNLSSPAVIIIGFRHDRPLVVGGGDCGVLGGLQRGFHAAKSIIILCRIKRTLIKRVGGNVSKTESKKRKLQNDKLTV